MDVNKPKETRGRPRLILTDDEIIDKIEIKKRKFLVYQNKRYKNDPAYAKKKRDAVRKSTAKHKEIIDRILRSRNINKIDQKPKKMIREISLKNPSLILYIKYF